MEILLKLVGPIAEYFNCDSRGVLYPILVFIPVLIFFVFVVGYFLRRPQT